MLVAGLLAVAVLKSWLVCFLFTTGLQMFFLGGVETTTSFEGVSKKQQRGCSFCL